MDAIMVETVGQPIVKKQRPIPSPEEGELLIKVTVVGLNPYEHRARDWGLFVEGRLPMVLGNDIAGTIHAIGPKTTTPFKKGDHVFGQTNYIKSNSDQSGLQEYCILDAYTVAKIPQGLTDDDGASLVCNIVAPFWAIFGADGLALPFPFPFPDNENNGNTTSDTNGTHGTNGANGTTAKATSIDYKTSTIVIIGAGSNCGRYAVQLCSLAGFGTIIVTADLAKHEKELKSYGATHIIDRHAPDVDVAARIRKLVSDDELVYAFDAVNSDHTLGVSILSGTKKGKLACMVPRLVDLGDVGEKREGYEDVFVQGKCHNQPVLAGKFWRWLPVWMEEGSIKSTGWEVLGGKGGLDVEGVNGVLDQYRDGKVPAKRVHVHL